MPTALTESPADRLAKALGRLDAFDRPRQAKVVCHARDERRARKLRLKDVAAACGITTHYLSDIETGVNMPGLDVAIRIARFYGKPVEALWALARDEEANRVE